jgi:capsule polysaccharide export protein KpsE/RkpR
MNEQIDAILARIRSLENELEREVEKGRAVYGPAIKENVAEFEQDVLTRHRRLKMGLVQFFRETPLLNVLTRP